MDSEFQRVLHLIHYGGSVLAVGGEASHTKTTWLSELESGCTSGGLPLCSIDLSGSTDSLQMLLLIAIGFGINYQRADQNTLTNLLFEYQQSQLDPVKSVVLIHHAELLDSSTVSQIETLSNFGAEVESLQFVLIYSDSDVIAEPTWMNLPDLYEVQIDPSFDQLEPSHFDSDESRPEEPESPSLFQDKLDEALTSARVRRSKLTEFLGLFVAAMKQNTVFGFPRLHLMVLSLVLVGVMFALLLAQQDETNVTDKSIVVNLDVPKVRSLSDSPITASLNRATPVSKDSAQSSLVAVTSANATDVKVKLAKSKPTLNAAVDKKPAKAVESLFALPSKPATTKNKTPIPEVIAKKAVAKKIVPKNKPKPKLTRRQQYEQQLLALNSSRYTLQLFGTYEQTKAEAFVEKYRKLSGLRYYRGEHKGKHWYIVVAGIYADSGAANAGVKRLPSDLQRLKPWPRTLGGIQSSIQKNVN